MDQGNVTLEMRGEVAEVVFDRPKARNALTFAMYEALAAACATINARHGLRAAVFRGAGEAFVAGTDISEFTAFAGAGDGMEYERRVDEVIALVETLNVPTLAVVDGPAVGGGLVIAAACDLRLVTPRARFGVPIARTVGNCLSVRNVARLERAFGLGAARKMLLLSMFVDGAEARSLGFALDCVESDALAAATEEVLRKLRAAAPLTIGASREAFRRLAGIAIDDSDIISRVYGSADFQEGVRAFLEKRKPIWQAG